MLTLFSMATGLQALRNEPEDDKRLVLGFPISNVFAVRNLENYSDGLLRACLLRLVLPSEWGSSHLAELEQLLREKLGGPDGDIVSGEILLAMLRNIVPPFSKTSFEQFYLQWLGDQLGYFSDLIGTR
jgi:hypothetical protein